MKYADVVVVGSGIAGLAYSLKLSRYFEKNRPDYKICVVTKGYEDEAATNFAQGGVAIVTDFILDSFEKHIHDTLSAGCYLNDPAVVDMVIKKGPERLKEMVEWGAEFDKNDKGEFELGKEGGHTASRVIHTKDRTGLEIEKILLEQIHKAGNVEILKHHFAIDLLTQHHLGIKMPLENADVECYGVYVMNQNTNDIHKILSKITVLATGGVGQVYMQTTNPDIATGDGIAMVYRAGGIVENMEFIQFHPTALYNPGERPSFLISEAVRGFGGILKTRSGKEFMDKYDERKSLAPRDIVARAIDNEMKLSGEEYVCLDCRHIDTVVFANRFPKIAEKCSKIGLDLSKDMIPVVPAAHYLCGGIKTNQTGQTTIKKLFAIGECASTGLHGANRLASNSLLEALVFAHNSFENTRDLIDHVEFRNDIPAWNSEGTIHPREKVLITHKLKELRTLMSDYVSIVKTNKRLDEAMKRLIILREETESLYNFEVLSPRICELRNMIAIAFLITKAAMERTQNIGLHYNSDLEDKSH